MSMKNAPFLLIIILSSLGARAQKNAEIDSLNAVLDTVSDKRLRVDVLNQLARRYNTSDSAQTAAYTTEAIELAKSISYADGMAVAYTRIGWATIVIKGNLDKAEELFQRALVIVDSAGSDREKANVLNGLGVIQYHRNNHNKAVEYLEQAMALKKEVGGSQVGLAGGYNNLGVIYEEWGRLEQALRNYFLALEIYENAGDETGVGNILNNIGVIYRKQDDFHRARDYYYRSLVIFEKLGYKDPLISSHTNLGTVYGNLNMPDSSLYHYRQALSISEEIGSKDGQGFGNHNLGVTNCQIGNTRLALQYLQKAYKIRKEIGRKKYLAQTAQWLGTTYGKMGDTQRQLEHLNEAHQLALDVKAPDVLMDVTKELASVHAGIGNPALAYRYFSEFYKLETESNDTERAKELARVEAEYEFRKKEDSLQFANEKERLLLNQQLSQQRVTQTAFILGSIVLIAIVIILYQFYRSKNQANKRLSALNQKVEQHNQDLKELNEQKNKLMGIVAHDLRSPLNQIKGLIYIHQLESEQKNGNGSQYLNQAIASAERLSDMVSRILNVSAVESKTIDLRMADVELTSILKQLAVNFEHILRSKRQRMQKELPDEEVFIRADINYLIQVIENLVGNAIKYSEPGTTITLRVTSSNGEVRIEVQDEGPGISEKDQHRLFMEYSTTSAKTTAGEDSTGLGLSIVKKYVEAMEGKIGVNSVPGEGSTFYISFSRVLQESIVNGR